MTPAATSPAASPASPVTVPLSPTTTPSTSTSGVVSHREGWLLVKLPGSMRALVRFHLFRTRNEMVVAKGMRMD